MGEISFFISDNPNSKDYFLLPDGAGKLDLFLKQFHNINEVINWCMETQSDIAFRNAPNTPRISPGLQTPNWPALPELKYNTLVWPVTGAARWGYFVGLASNDTANGGWGALGGSPGVLQISDGVSPSFFINMRKLCSRAITNSGLSDSITPNVSGTDLSLVVLVDPRYFLQYSSVEDLSNFLQLATATQTIKTYDQLFAKLGTLVQSYNGGTLLQPNNVDEKFLVPDITELVREYSNLPQFIDAVAMGIGRRIVCGFDEQLLILDPLLDAAAYNPDNNFNVIDNMRAGQRDFAQGPDGIVVTFPMLTQGHPYCDGRRVYQNFFTNVAKTDPSLQKTANFFTSTCYADVANANLDFSDRLVEDATYLTNKNALKDLADKLMACWCGWKYGTDDEDVPAKKTIWDVTWNGIVPWTFTGYDNYVEIQYGNFGNDQLFTMRCQSLTEDFGIGTNYSQDKNLTILPDVVQWGYVTSGSSPITDHPPNCNWTGFHSNNTGSPASVQIGHKVYNTPTSGSLQVLDSQLPNYSASNALMEVQAYPVGAADCLNSGDRVQLLWSCQDNIWLAFKLKGKATFISGTLKTTLDKHDEPPASATVNVLGFWGGYNPTLCFGISQDLTVTDVTNIFSGSAGTFFLATYDECSDRYIFSAMGCS